MTCVHNGTVYGSVKEVFYNKYAGSCIKLEDAWEAKKQDFYDNIQILQIVAENLELEPLDADEFRGFINDMSNYQRIKVRKLITSYISDTPEKFAFQDILKLKFRNTKHKSNS